MKLKNMLIVVKDIEKARRFYQDLFGLELILDNDGNMILSEGLVLQEEKYWKEFLGKEIIPENNSSELYFEESDLEGFVEKLESYYPEVRYVNRLMTHSWGQRVIRFYDPDGHIIEVGENMEKVVQRFVNSGLSAGQTAERMGVPLGYVLSVLGNKPDDSGNPR